MRLNETGRLLLSLYIPTLALSFGQGMVVPVIPTLSKSFDISVGLAAQVVSVQLLARLLFLMPSGAIVDRWGRRPALLAGPLIIALGAVAMGLAPNFWALLGGQLISGLGTTLWQLAREVSAMDLVRQEQRGRLMSGFMGMGSVGESMGPIAGGFITDRVDFHTVFFVYAGIALVSFVVSLTVPETGKVVKGPMNLFNIGRLREVEPQYRPTFVVIVINTFVAMMRGSLRRSILPLFVVTQLQLSSTELGVLFGVIGMVEFLMIAPTGIISDKLGRKAAVVPSAILGAIAFLTYPLATTMPALIIVSAAGAVATGLALGTMATYTYDVIPVHARGRLQTLRRTIGEFGGMSGPIMGGAVTDLISPAAAFLAFVPLQLVSGVLIAAFAKETIKRPRREDV
ncbi:MAG: MFS transporter [Dehalococcoidia bacterium]|nr:MFS transporter [Dehalococcoidia bacterium]